MENRRNLKENILQILAQRLRKAGIDISQWGKGEAKTLEHLQREIESGETILSTDAEGKIIREVLVSGADVFYVTKDGKKYRLKEEKQVFKDGRERRRNFPWSISEKGKPGETPREMILRGIKEELGLEGNFQIEEAGKYSPTKTKDSQSYPGLVSRYTDYRFIITLNDEQFKPEGYTEKNADQTSYFVWKEVE